MQENQIFLPVCLSLSLIMLEGIYIRAKTSFPLDFI